MGKKGKLIMFVVSVSILFVLLVCLLFMPVRRSVLRELNQEEIRPKIKSMTGKELPDKVENLRAVIYSIGEQEIYIELFVAFQTDPNGCSYVLKEFGGQDVQKQISFQEQYEDSPLSLSVFDHGYRLQDECGVVLFDMDLVRRVRDDYLSRHAITGNFREGAVSGYYICFEGEYEPKIIYNYHVLVFIDQGLVYICAEKKPEGLVLP